MFLSRCLYHRDIISDPVPMGAVPVVAWLVSYSSELMARTILPRTWPAARRQGRGGLRQWKSLAHADLERAGR